MKRYLSLLFVSVLGGILTLGAYIAFFHQDSYVVEQQNVQPEFIPANFNYANTAIAENVDFTIAAENTVNAVVHVRNTTTSKEPSSLFDYFRGNGGKERAQVGMGSGVIISPDGYIVTNNHVIENSTALQVTLNNNKSYEAELIGADPSTDIALLKINTKKSLPYLIFGDSDNTKIGEWVLAVGNPFNLTSTVTAGIISAKARDLNERDRKSQSFIQTDAAVNPGNSGGALVDTRGNLIGINTAISSRTGSYVGYSFAVPSNIARKIVEDIMEYGSVQKGMLGISGLGLNSYFAEELEVQDTEGIYVNGIEEESGAEKAGIIKGDIIKKIDGLKVSKFSDLTGYISSKRPNDLVDVTVKRDKTIKTFPVKLTKTQLYEIDKLGIEVKNLSKTDKKNYKIKTGVKIARANNRYLSNLEGKILVAINDEKVKTIDDKLYIKFSVKDTGIGIPKELHQTIFNKFTQADDSFTRKYGGTGLGLAIAKEIINTMGGKLEVNSSPGEGSIFYFTIPFIIGIKQLDYDIKHRVEIDQQKISKVFEHPEKYKILIAEDNIVNLKLLEKLLEKKNLAFTSVDNGKKALLEAEQNEYSLILMDVQMPVMDGIEASQAIKKKSKCMHVPIIALTAHAIKGDRDKIIALGVDDYMSKPVVAKKFFSMIAEYLSRTD